MKRLRELALQWRNRDGQVKSLGLPPDFLPFEEARQAGILFHADMQDAAEAAAQLAARLEEQEKKVSLLSYTAQAPSAQGSTSFSKKDISVLGDILNAEVQHFMQVPFDYLFHLHLGSFPPLDYVLLRCKARMRIGIYHPTHVHPFQLMVAPADQDSMPELTRLMLHYLKQIRTPA
jgi:hypothetical protein